MQKQERRKYRCLLLLLTGASGAVFCASILVGRYGVVHPIALAGRILQPSYPGDRDIAMLLSIIRHIRLPRTCAAFLVGASLADSGLVYQSAFQNKLVSPGILGVTSGCCVGAGIAILRNLPSFGVSLSAFLFGAASVALALLLPRLFRNQTPLSLVLAGIIVGSFMDSVISLIKFVADRENKLSEITFWMMGSLAGIQMEDIGHVFWIIAFSMTALSAMAWNIDVISLGRDVALSLGIHYAKERLKVVAASTMLTAACVSISGNIGWVGLVVPHIARALVGENMRRCLPVAAICGGLFMMIVDMLSRLITVNEIPLSVISGLLGAVIYSAVLMKRGSGIEESSG